MPRDWTRGEARVVATTPIFDVTVRHARNPQNGHEGDYVVLETPDWVNVVAVTEAGDLILVRQYRHGTGSVTLEIPGGMVDEGEDVVAAGLRELREETGYAPKGGLSDASRVARVIHRVHPNPAFMTNACTTVLVEGCVRVGAPTPDPGEDIEVVVARRNDVERWMMDGTVTHSLALTGLFAWWMSAGSGRR